ncbi:hypothetical protein [Aureivirga sp. CE67]|uniref:hypothetical protein n=1 Tax=Aureivirga sp. CE67 TaxID=1788983 RepID=UPI0018CBCA65|nr:hypothetical protein [Aureivirga sp. CE67]
MKNFIFTLLFSVFTLGAFAQEPTQYEKDTRELVEMVYQEQYESTIKSVKNTVQSKFKETFYGQGKRQLKSLFSKYSKTYMEMYSHQEIQDKLTSLKNGNQGEVLEKTTAIEQLETKWEQNLQGLASKYNSAS